MKKQDEKNIVEILAKNWIKVHHVEPDRADLVLEFAQWVDKFISGEYEEKEPKHEN